MLLLVILVTLQLWNTRVTAGCEQHGINHEVFKESLTRENVMLNRKTLATLACWEPYTFKSLTDIAKQSATQNGLDHTKGLSVPDVVVFDPNVKQKP